LKFVKVFGSLNENGLQFITSVWEFINETKVYYVIQSEATKKNLRKEELNTITSNTNFPYISYQSFCYEHKTEEIKEEMIQRMRDSLERQEDMVRKKRYSFDHFMQERG
jgi:hypothetical protein